MPKNTNSFKDQADYIEASIPRHKMVLMGRKYNLKKYHNDIDKFQKRSDYYGCVLYPERRQHAGEAECWTYEKNQAFWAGAIDNRRRFLLVNDINHYKHSSSVVVDELFWLLDNGYHLKPYPFDPLMTLVELSDEVIPSRLTQNSKY